MPVQDPVRRMSTEHHLPTQGRRATTQEISPVVHPLPKRADKNILRPDGQGRLLDRVIREGAAKGVEGTTSRHVRT